MGAVFWSECGPCVSCALGCAGPVCFVLVQPGAQQDTQGPHRQSHNTHRACTARRTTHTGPAQPGAQDTQGPHSQAHKTHRARTAIHTRHWVGPAQPGAQHTYRACTASPAKHTAGPAQPPPQDTQGAHSHPGKTHGVHTATPQDTQGTRSHPQTWGGSF